MSVYKPVQIHGKKMDLPLYFQRKPQKNKVYIYKSKMFKTSANQQPLNFITLVGYNFQRQTSFFNKTECGGQSLRWPP